MCNLNQFRRSKIKTIEHIRYLLSNFTNEKRNKSDGSTFEKNLDTRKNSIKKDFDDDFDDEEGIDYDEISLDEDVVLQDLVVVEASFYTHDELKYVGHQFNDTILSCSWRGFDCKSG